MFWRNSNNFEAAKKADIPREISADSLFGNWLSNPSVVGSKPTRCIQDLQTNAVGSISADARAKYAALGGTARERQAAWRKLPSAESRQCRACGTTFHPTNLAVSRGAGWYCSKKCAGSTAPCPSTKFITPESTKRQRVAANGLVNMRIRRGEIVVPKQCMKCGRPAKLDKHHPDYNKPDEVLFLCRSCHMRAHHKPETLAGLNPVTIESSPSPGSGPRHGETHRHSAGPVLILAGALSPSNPGAANLSACGVNHG